MKLEQLCRICRAGPARAISFYDFALLPSFLPALSMVIPTPRASITAVPQTCQARPTRSRSVALNNSSNDTLKCSKSEDCVYLPETLLFLAVEFSSIASYRGSQSSWHRQPKLGSSLIAGTCYSWNLLRRRRRLGQWARVASIPRLVQSNSSYHQNKNKKQKEKHKRERGQSKDRLGKRVGKNKGRVRLYFT